MRIPVTKVPNYYYCTVNSTLCFCWRSGCSWCNRHCRNTICRLHFSCLWSGEFFPPSFPMVCFYFFLPVLYVNFCQCWEFEFTWFGSGLNILLIHIRIIPVHKFKNKNQTKQICFLFYCSQNVQKKLFYGNFLYGSGSSVQIFYFVF